MPITLATGLGQKVISWRPMIEGITFSIAPNFDVVFFHLGVSWFSVYAHRGFTHSLLLALICALLLTFCFRQQGEKQLKVFLFGFVAMVSHTLLDAITWGGQGVALYWPISDERVRMTFNPLPASPMQWEYFVRWGEHILRAEFRYVWVPLFSTAFGLAAVR